MSTLPRKILLVPETTADVVPELQAAADVSARTGAPVRLVHIGSDIPRLTSDFGPSPAEERFAGEERQRLDEQIGAIEARGGMVAESFGAPGASPGHEVVQLTRDEDVGLVIVRDHGLGRFRYASHGSVPAHIVRDADCPVLVVRGSQFERDREDTEEARFPRTVLLTTDGSPESELAARRTVEICRPRAALHLVHVRQEQADGEQRAREMLDKQAERIYEAGATVAGVYPRHGEPVEEILGLSRELDAELVVLGGGNAGSMRELVTGTVSGDVIRAAECSVLVVRGDLQERQLVDLADISSD